MNGINPIDARIVVELSRQLEKDMGLIYKRLEEMIKMGNTMTGILEGKLTAVKRDKEEEK